MIAHINEYGEEQTIKEHLEGTAKRAQTFAQEFGCGDMGKFCGLLHDIGKYSKEFQERIKDPKDTKKVDHSTAGAIEAKNILNGNLLASMIIAGHHSIAKQPVQMMEHFWDVLKVQYLIIKDGKMILQQKR